VVGVCRGVEVEKGKTNDISLNSPRLPRYATTLKLRDCMPSTNVRRIKVNMDRSSVREQVQFFPMMERNQ
jgi:hypothetical protein